MARYPDLAVSYTRQARAELDGIWEWNAKKYDRHHATEYVLFLERCINGLAQDYPKGKPVNGFPDLHAITFKRRSGGDGHVVIYEPDEANGTVNILHVYHTKQDIQGRLEREHS